MPRYKFGIGKFGAEAGGGCSLTRRAPSAVTSFFRAGRVVRVKGTRSPHASKRMRIL